MATSTKWILEKYRKSQEQTGGSITGRSLNLTKPEALYANGRKEAESMELKAGYIKTQTLDALISAQGHGSDRNHATTATENFQKMTAGISDVTGIRFMEKQMIMPAKMEEHYMALS